MFSRDILASRIRQQRLIVGLSQSDLSKLVKVNRTTITLIEGGERVPSVEVLCAIADALGVTTDYLLGRSDDPYVTSLINQSAPK